jgi:hypothetical protein
MLLIRIKIGNIAELHRAISQSPDRKECDRRIGALSIGELSLCGVKSSLGNGVNQSLKQRWSLNWIQTRGVPIRAIMMRVRPATSDQIHPSGVDLTFATHQPRIRDVNVKSQTPPAVASIAENSHRKR